MGYDRGDSFPFDFEPNAIPFGSENGKENCHHDQCYVITTWSPFEGENIGCFIANRYYDINKHYDYVLLPINIMISRFLLPYLLLSCHKSYL